MASTIWKTTNAAGGNPPSLTVNGEPFFARGVCYSPVPWGGNPDWEPNGDFFFGPWNGVWQRDIPLMRASGINMIRIYNLLTAFGGWPRDHGPFLDACWNGGVDPIFVQVGYGDVSNLKAYVPWGATQGARDAARTAFLQMVTAYRDHPAVMGFNLGNEINNGGTIHNSDFWNWLDALAVATKAAAPDKITLMSLVDDSMESVQAGDKLMPNLDLWGINSYRGKIDFPNTNNFDNLWTSFAAASTKPLMLTEWGAPASSHDAQGNLIFSGPFVAGLNAYITGHYADIGFNAATTTSDGGSANPNKDRWAPVCVGSAYFEWTDEWWKLDAAYPELKCAATVQNAGKSANAAFPGGWGDEECFGLNAISPAGPDPQKRPGPPRPPNAPPNWVSCPGPWNFGTNQPYPLDELTPRESLATLTKLWKAG